MFFIYKRSEHINQLPYLFDNVVNHILTGLGHYRKATYAFNFCIGYVQTIDIDLPFGENDRQLIGNPDLSSVSTDKVNSLGVEVGYLSSKLISI